MIRKIGLQAFASYEGRRVRGVGRPQKVDRQEMIGAVAAVRHWITMNHEDRLADSERRSRNILNAVAGIPGLTAQMIDNIIGHHAYGLNLWVDPSVAGMDVYDLRDRLKDGSPPIWTRVRDDEDFITIHMFGLNPGEDKIVGERISALFGK
jgi:L-seryl-tRNA(Ser) seleniumtransferase